MIQAPAASEQVHRISSRMESFWKRFRGDRLALAGLVVIAVFLLAAVAAPLLAPFDPSEQFLDGLTAEGSPLPPNPHFWFGTDTNGRVARRRWRLAGRNCRRHAAMPATAPRVCCCLPELFAHRDIPATGTLTTRLQLRENRFCHRRGRRMPPNMSVIVRSGGQGCHLSRCSGVS